MGKGIIYISILILLLSSCNVAKYTYFNEPETKKDVDSVVYNFTNKEYYLQSQDILYIRFHSTMSEADDYFRFPTQQGNSNTHDVGGRNGGSGYLTEYVINEKGFIKIPVIGDVYVRGYQVNDIEEIIEKEAKRYISDVMVKVKLLSFRVSFLGEFNGAGERIYYRDKVHILNALAQGGELTFYTKWKEVRIMRQTETGIYSFRVDLNDASLLEDEKFYLQPNDIVYAEPSWRRLFRVNVADYTLILGTITTTIGFIALMFSLSNN